MGTGRTLGAPLSIGVVVVAAVAAVTVPHAAAAGLPAVTLAREIAVSSDTQITGVNLTNVDVSARRLVLSSPTARQYVSYDLDTGQVAARVPTAAPRGLAAALDSERHVLYGIELSQSTPPVLLGLDTRSLATVVQQQLLPGMYDQYEGLVWSSRDQLLYMVYQAGTPSPASPLTVAAIDPRATSGRPVLWQAGLPGCQDGLGQASNTEEVLGLTRDGRYLVTACIAGGAGLGAVARLALPPDPRSVTGTWREASTSIPAWSRERGRGRNGPPDRTT